MNSIENASIDSLLKSYLMSHTIEQNQTHFWNLIASYKNRFIYQKKSFKCYSIDF